MPLMTVSAHERQHNFIEELFSTNPGFTKSFFTRQAIDLAMHIYKYGKDAIPQNNFYTKAFKRNTKYPDPIRMYAELLLEIDAARKEKGLSTTDVANRLGMCYRTFVRYSSMVAIFDFITLIKYANLVEVDVEKYFFEG